MIIASTIILFCVTCGGILFLHLLKKHQHRKLIEVQRSLEKLVALKDLLIHIQQHRGLSTSVLHGNESLKRNLEAKKNTLQGLWKGLLDNYPELFKDSLFEGIYSHWQRLEIRCLELSSSNNIEQHNRLITNLLYLIENQAEENRLLIHFTRQADLEVIWKELLETIEAIGQTRAIGMGLVSEGKSTAVERIQLKYLSDRVCSRLQTLNSAFMHTAASASESETYGNFSASACIKTAESKINELQTFINKNLLKAEIGNISGEQFFQLASSAIEPLDTLFNLSSRTIKERCMLKIKDGSND